MAALHNPHIHKAGEKPARLDRWPRIRVAQIAADHLGYGWSAEKIARQYPHLAPAEIHAALAYYFDHREEIDAELDEEVLALDEDEEMGGSPLRLRLIAAPREPVI